MPRTGLDTTRSAPVASTRRKRSSNCKKLSAAAARSKCLARATPLTTLPTLWKSLSHLIRWIKRWKLTHSVAPSRSAAALPMESFAKSYRARGMPSTIWHRCPTLPWQERSPRRHMAPATITATWRRQSRPSNWSRPMAILLCCRASRTKKILKGLSWAWVALASWRA